MDMKPETHLHGSHQSTYEAVFQHPISRNLQWREVRSLLDTLSETAVDDSNGNVKFTRNGQTISIHPPQRKDFSDVEEIMKIRHFLERSAAPAKAAAAEGDGLHLLVVIDHREARIFKAERHGSTPLRITPLDTQGSVRYLHSVGNDANGQRKPELRSFYDSIANALSKADKILMLGTATGASSAMDHLMEELKHHRPAIAKRVVGAVAIDEKHMTDDQLLAQARSYFEEATT